MYPQLHSSQGLEDQVRGGYYHWVVGVAVPSCISAEYPLILFVAVCQQLTVLKNQ
jgi:hypothetical protein